MPLSPEAERWLRASFPVGRLDDSPQQAAKRRGWPIVGYLPNGVEAVAPGRRIYTITQTDNGPRAQENR